MLEIILEGETPAKKNRKIFNTKTHRMFPSKKYQEWHTDAYYQIRRQIKDITPITSPVSIEVQFYHKDKRRRDSDNGLSSILDLLVDCGILADDCWQIVNTITIFNSYNEKSFCKINIKNL